MRKKILRGSVLFGFVGLTSVSLSSCSFSTDGVLRTYSPTDYLASNNSPLNSTFNNSPISSYANSAIYNLLSYQTTGNFSFNGSQEETKVEDQIKDTLILEGASAVIVFDSESTMQSYDSQKSIDLTKLDDNKTTKEWLQTLTENKTTSTTKETNTVTTNPENGTNYWIFYRDQGGIKYQNNKNGKEIETTVTSYFNDAISKGKVYQFLVDRNNYWVDSQGNKQAQLSSKDFERGIESYTLASELNYNRNGYFLDLLGLDFDKTLSYANNAKDTTKYAKIDSVDYDVENYTNANDNFFTIHITTPYPYAFDLLSKEFFSAIPHTNQKVKNITLKGNTPIKYKESNGTKTINETETDWSRIYGSGGLGQFTKDTWYAGAYYISSFTSSKLVFELNNQYMETIGHDLLDWSTGKKVTTSSKEDKIKTISITFGSGTTDTYYEMFKSKQNDYLSAVPSSKMSEAAQLFAGKGLVPTKVVQTAQSNYIAYTPTVFTVDANTGTISPNNYIGNMTKLLYKWNSEESITIRAGIAGLVNYSQLSLLNLPGSGDFQLSATPYGVFTNYYESISQEKSYGSLPRPYTDYTKSQSTILGEFSIPYYTYSDTDITYKKLTINESTFRSSLEKLGATKSSPLGFSIKFGEGSFSTNYTSFLNKLKSTIETLSGGLISVSIVGRNATTPSATDWYNSQSSPLGYSYWSPDYNAVGTWIEADTTLQSKKINNATYEGVSGTNSHNAYLTFLQSMVNAVKKMKATWDSTSQKYKVNSLENGTDPFKDDERIQKAFSNSSLESLGVSLSSASTAIENSSEVTYDENYALKSNVLPGNRYGLLAIGFLNKLFENGVFKKDGYTSNNSTTKESTNIVPMFQKYVEKPSLLVATTDSPSTVTDVYRGGDVIASGQSGMFSKWVGVYSGESIANALYENFVIDSDYNHIPRSESGLKDITYSLVNPNYVARAGTQGTNYRDFGLSKK